MAISNNGTISSSVLASINGTGTKSSSSTSSNDNSAEGIQNRFLNLLVTQLQNQDPLNPMDNAQMTTQLAQISTLQGLTQLNETMTSLLSMNTDNQTLQAAGLIGKSVLVNGDKLSLSSGQASGSLNLAGNADTVTVTIKNASGATVKTLSLGGMDAGNRNFTWDGSTNAGGKAGDGVYTVTAEASLAGENITVKTLGSGVVGSVFRDTSGVSVNLGSLGKVALSNIQQIL